MKYGFLALLFVNISPIFANEIYENSLFKRLYTDTIADLHPSYHKYKDSIFINPNFYTNHIKKFKCDDNSQYTLNGDSIYVYIKTGDFKEEEHKISSKKPPILEIDGNLFFGTDGTMPTIEIKEFIIKIKGDKIKIPSSFYKPYYQPNVRCKNMPSFGVFKINNGYGILMNASDGAFTYSVLWRIINNEMLYPIPILWDYIIYGAIK